MTLEGMIIPIHEATANEINKFIEDFGTAISKSFLDKLKNINTKPAPVGKNNDYLINENQQKKILDIMSNKMDGGGF